MRTGHREIHNAVRPIRSGRKAVSGTRSALRPPYWPRARSYYFIAAVSSGLLYLLFLVILLDEPEEYRHVLPVFSGGILFVLFVFLREVVMRRSRTKYIREQKLLDRNLSVSGLSRQLSDRPVRLSLERHSSMLAEIRSKSQAAITLGRLTEGHLEVVKLCEAYLERMLRELPLVSKRSPRFPAFKKGRREVRRFHKDHLLKWTELETRSLTRQASKCDSIIERIELLRKARDTVDLVLRHYPANRELIESHEILEEMIVSINVAEKMQYAEAAKKEGLSEMALSHFWEALKMISEDMLAKPDFSVLASSIESEIKKLEVNTEGINDK